MKFSEMTKKDMLCFGAGVLLYALTLFISTGFGVPQGVPVEAISIILFIVSTIVSVKSLPDTI